MQWFSTFTDRIHKLRIKKPWEKLQVLLLFNAFDVFSTDMYTRKLKNPINPSTISLCEGMLFERHDKILSLNTKLLLTEFWSVWTPRQCQGHILMCLWGLLIVLNKPDQPFFTIFVEKFIPPFLVLFQVWPNIFFSLFKAWLYSS